MVDLSGLQGLSRPITEATLRNRLLGQGLKSSAVVPVGGIIMWSGAITDIPDGWALCDGSEGTPDLRNRFVVGAGSSYAVGATGGASTVALTTANMPIHSHGAGSLQVLNVHDVVSDIAAGTGAAERHRTTGANEDFAVSGSTANAGSGTAHENRPPYYALAYIMRTS